MIKNDETLKPSLIKSLGASIRLSQMNLKLNFLFLPIILLYTPILIYLKCREESYSIHGGRIFDSMGKIAGLGSIFEAQK